MPSSNNRFEVISTNNKAEDKWFIVTIIAIVSLSANLLYWQAHDNHKAVHIVPKEISAIINQLASTGDEVNFLIEAELLPAQPNLVQLQQESVVPFNTLTFSNPVPGCFITHNTTNQKPNESTDNVQYQIALWLDQNGNKLAWRAKNLADKPTTNDTSLSCQQVEQGWNFVESHTENHNENHTVNHSEESHS